MCTLTNNSNAHSFFETHRLKDFPDGLIALPSEEEKCPKCEVGFTKHETTKQPLQQQDIERNSKNTILVTVLPPTENIPSVLDFWITP